MRIRAIHTIHVIYCYVSHSLDIRVNSFKYSYSILYVFAQMKQSTNDKWSTNNSLNTNGCLHFIFFFSTTNRDVYFSSFPALTLSHLNRFEWSLFFKWTRFTILSRLKCLKWYVFWGQGNAYRRQFSTYFSFCDLLKANPPKFFPIWRYSKNNFF